MNALYRDKMFTECLEEMPLFVITKMIYVHISCCYNGKLHNNNDGLWASSYITRPCKNDEY